MHLRTAIAGAVGAVLMFVGSYTVKAAQSVSPTADPLAALLSEVHALRLAMEHSATVTPRIQLTLARLNIEEQRIAQLAAQLDRTRRELTDAALETQKLADALAEIEKDLPSVDPNVRKGHENMQTSIKQKMAATPRNPGSPPPRSRRSPAGDAAPGRDGCGPPPSSRCRECY